MSRRKMCRSCGESKLLTAFSPHTGPNGTRDGLRSSCRECRTAYSTAYKLAHRKEATEGERKRRKENAEEFRASRRALYRKNRRKFLAERAEWVRKNPEKARAHLLLNLAVRSGEVQKPTRCTECHDEVRINGHHEDYSRPLDVKWVCHRCHAALHKKGADE